MSYASYINVYGLLHMRVSKETEIRLVEQIFAQKHIFVIKLNPFADLKSS